jgi:hypothetical protein
VSLEEELRKLNAELRAEGNRKVVRFMDYEFWAEGNRLYLPIPLPKGNESLDDLVEMGIRYARASRMVQAMGPKVEYRVDAESATLLVVKEFASEEELWRNVIKALSSIETLRYWL